MVFVYVNSLKVVVSYSFLVYKTLISLDRTVHYSYSLNT